MSEYEIDKLLEKKKHWDNFHKDIQAKNKKSCCVYCYDENSEYHIILPCAHAVGICSDCNPIFKKCKKCMVCNKLVTSVQKAFVID